MRRQAARRAGAVGVGILIALVLLELLLQAAAAWTWWREGGSPRAGDDAATVLCVGDSFTYGLGLDEPSRTSYPAQLQQRLDAQHPGRERVAIEALPGRDSRDALAALPGALARRAPATVFVLIGANDAWSRPAPLERIPPSGSSTAPFRLCCRTARLLALLAPRLRVPPPSSLPAGVWHAGPERVEFAPDGTVLWRLGNAALEPRGDVLRIAAGGIETRFAVTPDGDLLRLTEIDGPAVILLEPGEPLPERAEQALEPALAAFRGTPSAQDARNLAYAAIAAGEIELAGEAIGWLYARAHDDPSVSSLLAYCVQLTEVRPRLVEGLDRALTLHRGTAAERAWLLRLNSQFHEQADPQLSLQRLMEAHAIDRGAKATLAVLGRALRHYARCDFDGAVASAGVDADVAAELRELFQRVQQPSDEVQRVLAGHAVMMVEACRAQGARPVLLSYPEPVEHWDRARAAAIAATGAEELDVRPRFAAELGARERSLLFVFDGHCTRIGYGVLADEVAKFLDRK